MDKSISRDYEGSIKEILKAYYFIENGKKDGISGNCNECCNIGVKQYPYFFIVGAGISAKVVKTAGQIINQCKEICESTDSDYDGDVSKQYSHWFQKAFPHKETRRMYLESLIRDKKIPEEATKLANILQSRKMTNLVITPNFDKFIYQALNILGEKNVLVADTPESVAKLNIESNFLNILHVHGTYEFYDCCNLESEIEKRAGQDGFFTAKSFLRNTLSRMSPIIIGYSGWEGDVIMTELRERLEMPLKYKIYWFCYNEKDYENIAPWVKYVDKENKIIREDIIFILPEKKEYESSESKDELKNLRTDNVLGASELFSSFIKEFQIKSPEIIQNPIEFLKNYYEQSLSENSYAKLLLLGFEDFGIDNDISPIKEAIIRKDTEKLMANIDKVMANVDEYNEKSIKQILRCLIIVIEEYKVNGIEKNNLIKIINTYKKLYHLIQDKGDNKDKIDYARIRMQEIEMLDKLDDREAEIEAIYNDVYYIKEDADIYKQLFRKCIGMKLKYSTQNSVEVYDNIINKIKNSNEYEDKKLQIRINMEKALLLEERNDYDLAKDLYIDIEKICNTIKNDEWIKDTLLLTKMKQAIIFRNLAEYDNEFAQYEYIIKNYSDNSTIRLAVVSNAMLLRANILQEKGSYEETIIACNEIEVRYKDVQENVIKTTVINSMVLKATALEKLEKYEDAVKVYNEIEIRYKEEPDNEIKRIVANSIGLKADALVKLEKYEDALKAYNEIEIRYKEEPDNKIKRVVVNSMIVKVGTLEQLEKYEDALNLYNEIEIRYKEEPDNEIKRIVANSIGLKADALVKLEKYEDALKAYNEIEIRYKEEPDNKIKRVVVNSMILKAGTLEQLEKYEDALNLYNEIEERYKGESDNKIKKTVATGIFFKAHRLSCMEKNEDALKVYKEIEINYKEETDKKIKEIVLKSMLNRASLISIQEKYEEALKIYDEIELMHKDDIDVKKLIATRIRLTIEKVTKVDLDRAKSIYEKFKVNYNDSDSDIKHEILLAEFILLINNMELDFNEIEKCAISASEINNNIREKVTNLICDKGLEVYNSNFILAEKYFKLLYDLDNSEGLNLAYMIRRNEVEDSSIYPTCDVILDKAISNGQELAYINKALILISAEKYDEAINNIIKIEDSNAFNWWMNMDDNEDEKYIVLFMGMITGKIKCCRSDMDTIKKKLESLNMNEFINEIEKLMKDAK